VQRQAPRWLYFKALARKSFIFGCESCEARALAAGVPRLFQSPEIKKPPHLSGGEFKEKVQVAPGQLFQRIIPGLSRLFYQMALFLPNRPTVLGAEKT